MHTNARTCAPFSVHSTMLDLNSAHSRPLPEQQSSACTSMHTRKLRRVSPRVALLQSLPYTAQSPLKLWQLATRETGSRAPRSAARGAPCTGGR